MDVLMKSHLGNISEERENLEKQFSNLIPIKRKKES